jgi:hypothetical protein
MTSSGDYGLPYRRRMRRRSLGGVPDRADGLRGGRAERLVAAARRELGRARAGWRALPDRPLSADGDHEERPTEGRIRSLLRNRMRPAAGSARR